VVRVIERTEHDDVTAVQLTWWRSRVAGYRVFAYVVRRVLVDSGFPAVARDIAELIRDRPVRGAFITHHHEDHAGNAELLAASGVPLAMAPSTAAIIRQPEPIGFYRRFTWRAMPPLASTVIPFADDSLSLLHTPGHSADHHVVWDSATDTLFAGDLFLGVKVRIAHADEDLHAQVASLRAMVARRPSRVFCMHRGLVPNGATMLAVKADWMEETVGTVERLHAAGLSVQAIRTQLFGGRSRTEVFSLGDYSSINLVRAALRLAPSGPSGPSGPHAHQ
jgi:glyoxylase-like metal-dependent hydrolase (beta-lactamase superfamily II)